jgi:hypothetical protein
MRRWHAGDVIAVKGGTAACALLARRRQLRWGATGQEGGQPLPGDDLITDPARPQPVTRAAP